MVSPCIPQPHKRYTLLILYQQRYYTTSCDFPPLPPTFLQQRQQPKLPLYDQRPRMPQQSQALSGIPPPTAPLVSLAGPSRTGGAGVFGPLGPASGSNVGPANSVCRVCGKVAVFLCSSCRRVWYCNQQCQVCNFVFFSLSSHIIFKRMQSMRMEFFVSCFTVNCLYPHILVQHIQIQHAGADIQDSMLNTTHAWHGQHVAYYCFQICSHWKLSQDHSCK